MTLYNDLGIKKDATNEQIKTAYKAAAKRYHPDVADPDDPEAAEKYHKAAHSYRILGNDNLRLNYDKTGEESSGIDKQNFITSQAIGALCELVASAMDKLGDSEELLCLDFNNALSTHCEQGKIKAIGDNVILEKKKEISRAFREQISFDGDNRNNIFDNILKDRLSVIEKSINSNNNLLKVFDKMIEILDDYDFGTSDQDLRDSLDASRAASRHTTYADFSTIHRPDIT